MYNIVLYYPVYFLFIYHDSYSTLYRIEYSLLYKSKQVMHKGKLNARKHFLPANRCVVRINVCR